MSSENSHKQPQKLKLDSRVEADEHVKNSELDKAPDATSLRQSSAAQVRDAQDSNRNKHSGSAGGIGRTIDIVVKDHEGKETVVASRTHGGRETDISKHEKQESHHVSEQELRTQAERGDFSAQSILRQMVEAKTQAERDNAQLAADTLLGKRREFSSKDTSYEQGQHPNSSDRELEANNPVANNEKSKNVKADTASLEAVRKDPRLPVEKREFAGHIQEMREETKKHGLPTDLIDEYAGKELEPELQSHQSHAVKTAAENTVVPKFDIGKALTSELQREAVEQAKLGVGVLHGTINFGVNTLAGMGNVIRMAAAAYRENDPLLSRMPDIDKDGTKMLHDTQKSMSTLGRILVQYNTTLDPRSPLFGVDFDPEAKEMAINLAKALPQKVLDGLDHFSKADLEEQASISTEAILNIVTIVEGAGALKTGELKQLNTLAKVAEEGSELATLENIGGKVGSSEIGNAQELISKATCNSLEEEAKVLSALAKDNPKLDGIANSLKVQVEAMKRELLDFIDFDIHPPNSGLVPVTDSGLLPPVKASDVLKDIGKDIGSGIESLSNKMVGQKFVRPEVDMPKLKAVEADLHSEFKPYFKASGNEKPVFVTAEGEMMPIAKAAREMKTTPQKLIEATDQEINECGFIRLTAQQADSVISGRIENILLNALDRGGGKLTKKASLEAIDQIRETLRPFSKDIDKQNIAFAVADVDGERVILTALSRKEPVPGTLQRPLEPEVFKPRWWFRPRMSDSEYKLLEEFGRRFPPGTQGRIRLFTEQKPCWESCKLIIEDQFPARYGDDIELAVYSAYKNQALRNKGVQKRVEANKNAESP